MKVVDQDANRLDRVSSSPHFSTFPSSLLPVSGVHGGLGGGADQDRGRRTDPDPPSADRLWHQRAQHGRALPLARHPPAPH